MSDPRTEMDRLHAMLDAAQGEVSRLTAEGSRLRAELADKREKLAELRDLQVGIKNLTTESGAIEMSLHMAHDMMRACVAGFVKILDSEDAPNYVELAYSLRNDPERYTVTIQRPRGKTPGEVASEAKQQTRRAEAERDALKAAIEGTAEAIHVAHRIMACSSRDWSLHADDAWLYALIVGWDCELPEHASGDHDPIDCSGPNHLESFAERFGWTEGGIAKLRKQRRALAALDAPETREETDHHA
jgi:hypothetical protein